MGPGGALDIGHAATVAQPLPCKWLKGDHTGCPNSLSTPFGFESLDRELYGHPIWWFPRASQAWDLSSGLGAEARMGVQGISGAGKRPLGLLAKSRMFAGMHQLPLRPLGLGRGVGLRP